MRQLLRFSKGSHMPLCLHFDNMWVHLILLGCLLCFIESILSGFHKKYPERKSAKTAKIAWKGIYMAVTNPDLPNYVQLDMISKVYGAIAVLKMQLKNVMVVITDFSVAKKIMNDPMFVNRLPNDHFMYETSFNKPYGLVFSNGEYWRQTRKLTIKILHKCGFHTGMQPTVQTEVDALQDQTFAVLKPGGSKDLYIHGLFQPHILNIISKVVLGLRFDENDREMTALLKLFDDFNQNFNVGSGIVDIFPILRYIPGLTYLDTLKRTSKEGYEFFQKIVERSRQPLEYQAEPTFTDLFLEEIKVRENTPDAQYINEHALLVTVRDILFAGTDTTSNALEYAILEMALNAHAQRQVQQEIDQVIGDRQPDWSDRDRMPYTQATMLEILRMATPVPLSARTSLEDDQIDGNIVPKNSLVAINIFSIHMSSEIWDDPDLFRPERFLTDGKIWNGDKIIPFGFGKRACLGENLARLTLFLFLTSLLQKFTFSLAKNHPPPTLGNVRGISRYPVPFWVLVTRRHQGVER